MLVARELTNPGKMLDYESSLQKAIDLFPTDPTVAVEVDYYEGARISKEDLDAARADPSTFNKPVATHKNIDVEGAGARYEMKRVAPLIHDEGKLVDQVKEGVAKFTDAKIQALGHGGTKRNIVDVRYDDKIRIQGATESSIRARIERYVQQNRRMVGFVDEIAIHAEIDSKDVDIVVEVK